MSESEAVINDRGMLSRAVGILFSPAETLEAVIRYPRSASMLFVVCLVIGLSTGLPQFTERGRQATIEMQIRQIEQQGQAVPPEAYDQIRRFAPYFPYLSIGSVFVIVPVFTLLFTAVFWAVFNTLFGGTASFKQILAIVTHAQVVSAAGAVLGAPIQYAQGIQTTAGPFNLGALAPMLQPSTFMANFLGSISVFTIWQIVVSAIGVGVLYHRRSTGIAIGLLVAFLLITAGVVAGMSALGGG
jgi:hypothetical protein